MVEPDKYMNNEDKVWKSTNVQRLKETLLSIYEDFQIDIGMRFQNNSRRQPRWRTH